MRRLLYKCWVPSLLKVGFFMSVGCYPANKHFLLSQPNFGSSNENFIEPTKPDSLSQQNFF